MKISYRFKVILQKDFCQLDFTDKIRRVIEYESH